MGVRPRQFGKRWDETKGSAEMEEVSKKSDVTKPSGKTMVESPTTKEYQTYIKRVKKLGAKGSGIPTEAEYHLIQGQLRKKSRLARAIVIGAKKKPDNGYGRYMQETVAPISEEVRQGLRNSGLSDAEIDRRFGVK